MSFNSNVLFASSFWGSVGTGYFIFGNKQRPWPSMVGGIGIIAVSYLVWSVCLMSLASIAIMAGVYLLRQPAWSFGMINLLQTFDADQSRPIIFYRALEN